MSPTGPLRLLVFCGATGWGGAEIVLGHLLTALDPAIECSLMGIDADVLQRLAETRPGTQWATVPRVRNKRDVASMWAHRRAMTHARADVVHLNLPVPFADPYSVLAATTLRQPAVVTVVHLPMATPWPRLDRLVRATLPRVDAVVGVSPTAARAIEGLVRLESGSVRAVPNGVPEPLGSRVPRPATDRVTVGAVGRLDRQKGFDVLLHAVVGLPDVLVTVVGDGPERVSLMRLADDLGLRDRVSFPGWSADPAASLRTVDILAVPSRYEGLPLVVLEAMLAGVPIVASAVGGVPDAVTHDRSGLLVPPDDVPALTDALRRVSLDHALRRRLSDAAQREARARFTVETMTRSYETLYAELVDARRRRSVSEDPPRGRSHHGACADGPGGPAGRIR